MLSVGARAPTRLDFGGGWTDVPPYADREGGFVCNVAIDRRATVLVSALSAGADGALAADRSADRPLVEGAVRRADVRGVNVSLFNDFPIGAGLGGSSAAGVALAAALACWRGESPRAEALAERSRAVEVEELGVAGGWQDHFASAVGGALALRFRGGVTEVRRIPLDAATLAALERRCLVVYTGESRISADTITAVTDAYARGDRPVLAALGRLRALAETMADSLGTGRIDDLAALVGEHWIVQRSLHPAIPTARIDAIIAAGARAGALGAKALGASGGGCVLVIAPDDGVERVRDAVAPLGALLPFRIATRGVETFVASER